jgi:hypothetical protein
MLPRFQLHSLSGGLVRCVSDIRGALFVYVGFSLVQQGGVGGVQGAVVHVAGWGSAGPGARDTKVTRRGLFMGSIVNRVLLRANSRVSSSAKHFLSFNVWSVGVA